MFAAEIRERRVHHHRVSILRAIHRIAATNTWMLLGSSQLGSVLADGSNLTSYALGRLKAIYGDSCSDARLLRHLSEEEPLGVGCYGNAHKSSGDFWNAVQENIAWRDGDYESVKRHEQERNQRFTASVSMAGGVAGDLVKDMVARMEEIERLANKSE